MVNFTMMQVLMWQKMPQLSKSLREEYLIQMAHTLTNLWKYDTKQLLN